MTTELLEELRSEDAPDEVEEEGMDSSVFDSAVVVVKESKGVEMDEGVERVKGADVVEEELEVTEVLEVFEKADEVRDSKVVVSSEELESIDDV
ncbi:MAG: hypothetical protein Q9207_008268 [Kuettlingeria erythrocarpa]